MFRKAYVHAHTVRTTCLRWPISFISVVVGKMDDVLHVHDKTHISVFANQIIREVGSHFARKHRQSAELQGTIAVPRKCGVVKGDGVFLMTGRLRLGELWMNCAPYLHEFESMVNQAEREGWMECARDWHDDVIGGTCRLVSKSTDVSFS